MINQKLIPSLKELEKNLTQCSLDIPSTEWAPMLICMAQVYCNLETKQIINVFHKMNDDNEQNYKGYCEKAIKILNNLKMCMLPLNIYELDKRTRELKNYPEIVKLVEKLGKLSFKK